MTTTDMTTNHYDLCPCLLYYTGVCNVYIAFDHALRVRVPDHDHLGAFRGAHGDPEARRLPQGRTEGAAGGVRSG